MFWAGDDVDESAPVEDLFLESIIVAEGGVSDCPDGYEHVDSLEECKAWLKTDAKYTWQREDCWEETVGFKGCFINAANNVYYANCAGSQTAGGHQAVCKQKSGK